MKQTNKIQDQYVQLSDTENPFLEIGFTKDVVVEHYSYQNVSAEHPTLLLRATTYSFSTLSSSGPNISTSISPLHP